MNKMSIPAPFLMALPTPRLPFSVTVLPQPPSPPVAAKHPLAEPSSGGPEMGSSNDVTSCFWEVDENGASRGQKRVRRETIVGPVVDRDVGDEVAGLKPAMLV